MQKLHGPFRLTAGKHIEDEPVRQIKVKRLDGPYIDCEDGNRLMADQGGHVLDRGQQLNCYLDNRRVAAFDLRVNDVVTLAKETTYTPQSPPFFSMVDLVNAFNQDGRTDARGKPGFAGSTKFVRVTEGDVKALSEKDAEIARLRAALEAIQAGEVQARYTLEQLAAMNLTELRNIAVEAEIDLPSGVRSKEDILAVLKTGLRL